MKVRFMGFDEATIERFWSKVDKRGPDECWLWTGSVNKDGYGSFRRQGYKYVASRLSLQLSQKMPKPHEGILCLHSCDNRMCCNPAHLRWGTYKDNAKDKKERNHVWREKSSCRIVEMNKSRRKLLQSQISYIEKLLDGGFLKSECARWYGVSHDTIRRISLNR